MASKELPDPEHDARTVNELITAALTDFDSEAAWDAIAALHYRATWEVVERADALSNSACAIERSVAASMLAQLGVATRVYTAECQQILRRMLQQEKDETALDAIICALGHQGPDDLPTLLTPFISHPDVETRRRVAWAIWSCEGQVAIEHLMTLSRDDDPEVRDWATFGLGNAERDSPEIRQALLDRTTDSDCDTRGEALCGLVRLKHDGVLALVERELGKSGQISRFTVDAAELLADPRLIPQLEELQAIEGNDLVAFQRAIDACSKSRT